MNNNIDKIIWICNHYTLLQSYDREKKEQITEKNDRQDDLKDESTLNNPPNSSRKKVKS